MMTATSHPDQPAVMVGPPVADYGTGAQAAFAIASTLLRRDGHLFITVIAYQLVQVIRRRLRQSGETASWTTLRRVLEGQQRITATFRRTDGRTLHVRKATRAEPPQQAIYDALGVGSAPGGIRKSIV